MARERKVSEGVKELGLEREREREREKQDRREAEKERQRRLIGEERK